MERTSSWHLKFKSDVIVAIVIFSLPFFGFIHLLYSDNSSLLNLLVFDYFHVFPSNRTLIWYFFRNFIPMLLLITWFFTTSKLWKYLLLPMTIIYISCILKYIIIPMMKPLSGGPFGLINIAMVNVLIFTIFIVILILLDAYFFTNYRRQLLDISIKTLLNNNVQSATDTYKKVIDKIRKNRYKYSSTTYLYRIMNIKLLIDLWLLKNANSTENDISKKYLVLKNVLIILVLLITTILWFAHYLIPDNIQELDLGLLVIDSNGFDNVRTYIWFLLRKIIVIIPMLVWYFSCANWWRFAILSPITIYSYQLWEATQDIQHLDAGGNIKAFPFVVIVVILLIMVSKIIRYRVDLLTLYDAVVKEIDSIIQNGELRANKSFHQNILRIKQLRQEIAGESNQNRRLDRLIALREELISETEIRP